MVAVKMEHAQFTIRTEEAISVVYEEKKSKAYMIEEMIIGFKEKI